MKEKETHREVENNRIKKLEEGNEERKWTEKSVDISMLRQRSRSHKTNRDRHFKDCDL